MQHLVGQLQYSFRAGFGIPSWHPSYYWGLLPFALALTP